MTQPYRTQPEQQTVDGLVAFRLMRMVVVGVVTVAALICGTCAYDARLKADANPAAQARADEAAAARARAEADLLMRRAIAADHGQ